MKIGIFGGTFDPIHTGHLIVAETVRNFFQLDCVYIIPAKIPPHKLNVQITADQHRLNMVKLASADNPFFKADDIELKRSGYSYSVDTLSQFSEENTVFLIMGHDNFITIETWHEYEKIFSLCKVIVAIRPGIQTNKINLIAKTLQDAIGQRVFGIDEEIITPVDLPQDWKICVIPIPGLEISASEIRYRVSNGQSIKYLVPSSVEDYIINQQLYVF